MNAAEPPRIAGILLAAGAGSRFGGAKLQHPLEGIAIGVRSAQNMMAAGLSVMAVVRPGNEDLRRLLESAGCTVTECAKAAEGMGASLAHAVAMTRDAGGWVVALADMPRIQQQTTQQVIAAVAGGALIAAPQYLGARGHPVGFSVLLRDELMACQGDEGARAVLKRHNTETQLIPVDDPGVVFDIDRKEDLSPPL